MIAIMTTATKYTEVSVKGRNLGGIVCVADVHLSAVHMAAARLDCKRTMVGTHRVLCTWQLLGLTVAWVRG